MLVTTPATVAHYADSVQYLASRGFRYLICSLDYSARWTPRDLKQLERQYERLSAWYIEETRNEKKFYFSPFDVKIASHVYPGSCRAERCELGKRQISVAPNGRLYPCVQFVGAGDSTQWAIGDVFHGVDEARRHQLYARNAAEKECCSQCAIRERCNHYCGCLNRQSTGSIDTVSPLLCAHEQMTLRCADRVAEKLFHQRSALFVQKQYNPLFPIVSMSEDQTAR
jgi:uncharacterized protein